ncbi:MAG TPA: redoxin domain-containing protein [Chitinophagaceae bacterium]|nr:redoxin domain-containing protein [Chitinophagaceae bacterium]
MKKTALFAAFITVLACPVIAQPGSTPQEPAYKRFPTTPPLQLLLTDSATWFTKKDIAAKKPVFIMLFSPDCDHCQHETEEIIKRIDDLKKIQIIMSTTQPFEKMKSFYEHYGLSRFSNITVGKDVNYTLPVFYDVRTLPFLAFYNKKQELITVFEGTMPVDKVLETLNK